MGRIEGITIEIGGDTTKLNAALKKTDGQLKTSQDNLKDIGKLLKFDPRNTVLLEQKQKNLQNTVEVTRQKLEALKDAEKKASSRVGNYDEYRKAYEPLGKELEKVNKKSEKLKNQLSQMKDAGKVDSDEYKKLQQELEKTEASAKELRQQASELYQQFGEPIPTEEYDKLQREIIDTEQKLKAAEKAAASFGTVGAQRIAAFGQKLEAIGGKITAVGDKMSAAGKAMLPLTCAIVGVGTAAVKTAASFEDGMASVQATLGITSDATAQLNGETVNVMDSLETLARDMGAKTKFSATEAAEAINILAMAGYDTNQIYSGLPQLLSLAAAGDLEIASAADITTGILAGFNMETTESAEVVDKLAKLASSAKGNVSSFGAGLSTVAGQAQTTGQSFDDMAAALGILGNNNVSASEGGKMLQRVLKNLYQPTSAGSAALSALGVSAYDAEGKARALPEVLQDLQQAMAGMNDEAKNASMAQIFDVAAIRGANALIGSAGAAFDELKGKILDSKDAAQQMADVRMETLGGQLQILKSQAEEAGISFGKALMPQIKELVQKAQKAADWINKLNDKQKQAIVRAAALAAAAGPLLIVGGKLVSGVGHLVSGAGKLLQLAPKAVSAFNAMKAGALALNPALLAGVAAAAALAGGIALAVKAHNDYIESAYGMTQAQKDLAYENVPRKVKNGSFVQYDPIRAIKENIRAYQMPEPTNYNGRTLKPGVLYVIAMYKGTYGTYSLEEARAFGMEIKQSLAE